MKSLIVAFIFAIGLMVALPSTSSGSESPPGQVSFVIEQIAIAPVITFVQVATIEEVVVFELAGIKSPGYCLPEGIVQKAPDFCGWYSLNYRTCLSNSKVRNQNKLLAKNIQTPGPIKIRADTSGWVS